MPVWAVWVREAGPIPRGAERVEWLLWTNVPVHTLADAARVADLGGYDGRPSTRPPGATVIARGMEKVELIAAVLEDLEHEQK